MLPRPGTDSFILYRMHPKSFTHFQMGVITARLINSSPLSLDWIERVCRESSTSASGV